MKYLVTCWACESGVWKRMEKEFKVDDGFILLDSFTVKEVENPHTKLQVPEGEWKVGDV